MGKRYLTIFTFFVTLVGCFFLFFDKSSNKELYNDYFSRLDNATVFANLSENNDLNISIDSEYINNQYHYVITLTSNTTLNNFKAMAIPSEYSAGEYYPSFGIFDNLNINLVQNKSEENETKGVNLVLSKREKVEAFKIYVSYNNYEYYYKYPLNNYT
jgi:hypothetical protein